MKVNLIEVNVVVVNMFSRNTVGITIFKKSQTLPKFFLNLFSTRTNNYQLSKRVKTSNMPMFLKTCVVGVNFKKLLQSPGLAGKGESQADQLLCKVLK